jgi:hypothetical protein
MRGSSEIVFLVQVHATKARVLTSTTRLRGGGCAASKPAGPATTARSIPGAPQPPQEQHVAPEGDADASAIIVEEDPSGGLPLAPAPSMVVVQPSTAGAVVCASVPASVAPPATAKAEEGGALDTLRRLSRQASGALALFIGGGVPEAEARAEETHSVPLPAEIHRVLTKLDDRLIKVLKRGDIKLVRSAWLLAQPEGVRLRIRQELEAIEQGGGSSSSSSSSLSPLLSPAEAVALVRQGRRSAGVASHGWLSPGCADPEGARVVLLRRVLRERPDIEGVFFDYPSLYQKPRDHQQEEAFKRALGACQEGRGVAPCSLPRCLSLSPARARGCLALSRARASLFLSLPPSPCMLLADWHVCTPSLALSPLRRHGRPVRLGHRHHGAPDQGDTAAPRRVRRRPRPLWPQGDGRVGHHTGI